MKTGLMSGLAGLAVLLTIVFGLQVRSMLQTDGVLVTPSPHASSPAAAGSGVAAADLDRRAGLVATLLARPLFSEDRRPAAAAAAARPGVAAGLPRLTGIVVHGADRSVIFAPPPGGKPVVAREGGQIGQYRVQTIQAEQVTVLGPDGARVLHPSFDPQAPAPKPAGFGASMAAGPALLNLPPMPGFPGGAAR